jgi:drug/metabolite transporter (DMT)-like permease
MAIALALGSCLAWGLSDYIAGVEGRRLTVLTIALGSHCVGLLLLVLVIVARGGPLDPGAAFLPACAGGVFTAAGLLALYRALAIGPMTITAPISATGAAVPVVVGVVIGETAARSQWLGIALALAGVVLATRPTASPDAGGSPSLAGPALALAAAGLLGSALAAIDRASESDVLWTATLVHAAGLTFLGGVAWVSAASIRLPQADLPAVVAMGVLGAIGQAFFAWAASIGFVAIVGVLGSLYPITTVVLAQVLGRERVARVQAAGVALALVGVALISAA